MKIDCSFVHLHAPLFFAGRNWGEKLDIKNTSKGKIALSYDRDTRELHLECDGKEAFLPSTSVFSYIPKGVVLDATAQSQPERQKPGPKPKITAQVSGPHDHVFAQGPGKTRD